jgi:hypothetical protein
VIPENASYYHVAYIVAAVLYTGYVGSLWWRKRKVRARMEGRRHEWERRSVK